jgi:enamine deaminase RidA (YjgF/YER057c/UK114 family)
VTTDAGRPDGPSTPTARLEALGLTLPPVAAPVAAYVPAVRLGATVWTSGQLPFVDGKLPATGAVGDGLRSAVDAEAAQGYARTAALNALAAIAAEAGGLDEVARVVKVVVFVASSPDFTGQPQVANGASELFGAVFGSAHARSAVGVTVLPLDSPVEVEVVAELVSRPTVVPV